jgi:single-strand DNA-binding protein
VGQGKASIQLVGNLCRDPETRFSGQGLAITKFTVAVSTKGKGDSEQTAFIDCVCFDKRGEAFAKFHRKGARVAVDGRLQQENWTTKDTNEKRSKLSVVVTDWVFAGSGEKPQQSSMSGAYAPVDGEAPGSSVAMSEADDTPF